jgi:activator of HSP90 ATPase
MVNVIPNSINSIFVSDIIYFEMNNGNIHQVIILPGLPDLIFSLLMDAEKHSDLVGSAVEIENFEGGYFNFFDGYISGRNIELIFGKKIVQQMHFLEDGWPNDHYSVCTFLMESINNETKLTFTQTGIPEHKVADLEKGWSDYYWEPMKDFLENQF